MRYYCSADDLFFVKGFSFITGEGELTDTIRDIQKEGLWKSVKMILYAIPLVVTTGIISMIPNFPNKAYIGVPAGFIIVSLFIAAIANISKYNKEYRAFLDRMMNYPSNLEEEVLIYEITDEGLYFNIYNQTNRSDMLFISWESVQEGELDFLRYTDNLNKDKQEKRLELNHNFSEVRKRYKDFKGTRKLFHRDKKMIILNKSKVSFEIVPLPKSWTDEEIENFVGDIKKYIKVKKIDNTPIQII